MKKYIFKISKIVGYILIIFIGIFLLLVISLQIPSVQNFAKNKVVTFVQNKIKTKVEINRIDIGLPKIIILEGVLIEDQTKKVLLSAKKLKVDISLLELINNKIEINSVVLNQVAANIHRDEVGVFNFDYIIKAFATSEKPKNQSSPTVFSIDKINLDKIKFNYIDDVSKSKLAINIDHFDTKIKTFDSQKQLIEIKNLELSNTSAAFVLEKNMSVAANSSKKTTPNKWIIKVSKSNFKSINFIFDDKNSEKIASGIDYKHLNISNFNLDAKNVLYTSKIISGTINSFAVKENSGLHIKSLTTDFYYGQKKAYLKNLFLKTSQSIIAENIVVGFQSIEYISKNLENLSIKANFLNTKISVKDILLFAPSLKNEKIFGDNLNALIKINSEISGKLNNLQIANFEISGIGNSTIDLSGKIIGLPDYKKAFFDLKIKNLQTTASDINNFIPKNTIPKNVSIPKSIIINGNFIGKINDFKTNIKLFSSFGNVFISNGRFNNQKKNNEKYVAQTEFFDFDLGQLINSKSLGKISLKATINGTGFNPKTAKTIVNGTISKFYYNQYTFQNLQLNAATNQGLFTAKATSKDKNLNFVLLSSGSFRNQYPKVILDFDIAKADLLKINLYDQPMTIRGKIKADIQTAALDFLNAKISLNKFVLANATEQFLLDSVTVTAVSTLQNKSIALKSQFANATLSGNYKLSAIANSVQNSISRYYNLKTNKRNFIDKSQNFSLNVQIKESPILLKLFPKLKAIEPITFNARYNAINDSISVNGTIPKLIYDNYNIANAMIRIYKKDKTLVYNFFIDDFQSPQIQLPHTTLFGKLEDDILDYNLQIKDIKDVDRYYIAGKLKTSNAISEIILDPSKLLLNYNTWNISKKNSVKFGNNILQINDFELSKIDNSIKIQSLSSDRNAPIAIDFKNFQIATILNIAQKKELQIDGKINGGAVLKNIFSTPLFTSDLKIDDFNFKNSLVGNLDIQVQNSVPNLYKAAIKLSGQENDVLLSGNFRSDSSIVDMNLDLNKLNFISLEGFTADNIKESSGYLSGKINISGKASKPEINGALKFNEVAFKSAKLNAKFQSLNDKIVFSANQISFNKFKIKDQSNNNLVIDGNINGSDFSNLGFDLTIDAVNFNAVNSQEKDNNQFYGNLFLDNHLNIKGTANSPLVDGIIKINKDTKFTIVLPQDDPSIADREGIIEFIDQDNPNLKTSISLEKSLSQSEIKGINASVNIEIDKDAELSMVIDKANGDFLKLKGQAMLNGGIDQSGKTTLTGRYDLSEGSYEMSFNFIKRKFDIKKGSYLQWTGEPTTADVNITAVYKLETAPIDLLNDQLGNLNAETRNTYKQRIPFNTELKMKGELLKPTISFDIVLPDGNNSVSAEIINATQAKLTQLRQEPDELNKQVFALLLLNRFIGENPFASESGGTTAQGLARESASKILSQQLNNLAGNLIKGVEIDFNLAATEDYTTGQKQNRTDLNVGLSKTLLNDRLKVTVGSNFGLEGPKQENENQSTIAGDLAADYQLTKDGRYKVRAYRKNKFQVALQGQVVETGVGFIITIDYNKFKELFQKK